MLENRARSEAVAIQELSVEPLASEQGHSDSSAPGLILPEPDRDLELAPLSGNPNFSGDRASVIPASLLASSSPATSTSPNLYSYNVLARTGSPISGGTPISFEDGVSINDDGVVGFVGRFGGGVEDLLIGDTETIGSTGATIRNLTPAFSGSFSRAVQINNRNEVIGQNPGGSGSAVRVWAGNVTAGTNFATIATAAFPADNLYDFENTFAFPSINNIDDSRNVVFEADPPDGSTNPFVLVTSGFQAPATDPLEFKQKTLLSQVIRPLIADTGEVLVRDPASQIILYDANLTIPQGIAIAGTSSSASFNSVGLAPGISDNAKAITFFGDLQPEDAIAFGTTPGPGIFASVETSSGRAISRLAGIAGNGFLDPGETFTDTDSDGVFDQGTDVDQGIITSFAANERVGVSYNELADQSIGTAAYLAFNASGQETLFTSRFSVSLPTAELSASVPVVVARVGDNATNVSPDLTGTVADLSIYDPINNDGQVAFWTRTSTSQEAVVRANPVRRPVLIVPGIGGTLPENSDFENWLLDRGPDPNTLQFEQSGALLEDLIETLKRAGYTEGVNLFRAPWDWRLNPGPTDGTLDGNISGLSAEGITDGGYEFGVDYFGFWLEEAYRGWRNQFPGVPADQIPDLESLDVITYSAGFLVPRTYIQSDAYAQPFTFLDSNGVTVNTNLPKVNNLITIGAPYRGSSIPWRGLNGDFSDFAGILRLITSTARYKAINQNETITLSGNTNAEGAITPAEAAAIGEDQFVDTYAQTFRSLLATYPFIDRLLDNPSPNLITAESFSPVQENRFLLEAV